MAKKQKTEKIEQPKIDVLEGELCPMCGKKELQLTESQTEVPFFGKVNLFSMTCNNCKFHKADLETEEKHDPVKYTIEISGEEDFNIRLIKSAEATVKIPHVVTIESGPAAQGYITNIESLLKRVRSIIEQEKESSDDADDKKKAYKLIKKINRCMQGSEKLKIIIEDPSGNSAIISDKAEKKKL